MRMHTLHNVAFLLLSFLALLAFGCSDTAPFTADANSHESALQGKPQSDPSFPPGALVPHPTTSLTGRVYKFDATFTNLADAEITLLEHPELEPQYTDDNGHFTFGEIPAFTPATIRSVHPDFFPTQSGRQRRPRRHYDPATASGSRLGAGLGLIRSHRPRLLPNRRNGYRTECHALVAGYCRGASIDRSAAGPRRIRPLLFSDYRNSRLAPSRSSATLADGND